MAKGLSGENNGRYSTGLCMKGNAKRGIYNSWQNMKQRCSNPKNPNYARYGGRGIKVCDEWQTINGFLSWALQNGWGPGMTIDRIDNDGNYCPENCRFITAAENSRKKRTTKITNVQAEEIRQRIALGENEYFLADEYGVVHGTIWFIKNGYTHVPDGECTKKIKLRKQK